MFLTLQFSNCHQSKLTFSFASTSVEALDGSDGHTAGLGQGSMLSEALHRKYKSYKTDTVQEGIFYFFQLYRLEHFCNTSAFRKYISQDKHKSSTRYFIFWDRKALTQGSMKII